MSKTTAGFSLFCRGCGAHVHAVSTERPSVFVSVEYARDGFTPSGIRHECHDSIEARAAWLAEVRDAATSATACSCVPCTTPGRGHPGIEHCAACCGGSLIEEYDHDCPEVEHREMAELQFPRVSAIDATEKLPTFAADDEMPF